MARTSSALPSLPAMRNLACCQTNPAMSRVVKYLREARPRANQNSEAPIIIVLSTSKNAAAVGSGRDGGRRRDVGGCGGGGTGHVGPRRARSLRSARTGARATAVAARDLPAIGSPPVRGAGVLDPSGTGDGAFRALVGPVSSRRSRSAGGTRPAASAVGAGRLPAPGSRGTGPGRQRRDREGGGRQRRDVRRQDRPSGDPGPGAAGTPGTPGTVPATEGTDGPGTEGTAAVPDPGSPGPAADPSPAGVATTGFPAGRRGRRIPRAGTSAGTGPSSSAPATAGPAAQSSEESSPVTRVAMSASSTRDRRPRPPPAAGTSSCRSASPSDWVAAQLRQQLQRPGAPRW